jgi:fructokinase
VGRDVAGDRLLDLLERHGVDRRYVQVDQGLPTGRSTIRTSGFENDFIVHGPAAWDAIEGPADLPRHDVLVYGTLAARGAVSRATLTRLLEGSAAPHKVLDVNLRPPDVQREVLELTLGAATAVKLGEHELREVASLLDTPAGPEALFERFGGLVSICITRGEKGAALLERSGGSWESPASQTDAVNTVGAGDAFTAGMAQGLVEGLAPPEVLGLAQRTAASILGRKGGLPARAESG